MIALLKWTSIAFAGVIASTFLFITAVIFAVTMAPNGMPPWHIPALIAVTLYLGLFVLVALGRMLMLQPWGDTVLSVSRLSRRCWRVAMY